MAKHTSNVTAIAADHYHDPVFQAACKAVAESHFTDRILEARQLTQLIGHLLTRGSELQLNGEEMNGLALIFDEIEARLKK